MGALIRLSLVTNVVVLLPVSWGLWRGAPWVDVAYGPASPARSILLAVYVAILAASASLLYRPIVPAVATLLALQVCYKVLTSPLTGSVNNPVVAANLAISALHAVTLAGIWTAARVTP